MDLLDRPLYLIFSRHDIKIRVRAAGEGERGKRLDETRVASDD